MATAKPDSNLVTTATPKELLTILPPTKSQALQEDKMTDALKRRPLTAHQDAVARQTITRVTLIMLPKKAPPMHTTKHRAMQRPIILKILTTNTRPIPIPRKTSTTMSRTMAAASKSPFQRLMMNIHQNILPQIINIKIVSIQLKRGTLRQKDIQKRERPPMVVKILTLHVVVVLNLQMV
jgi:hypothetical protein